ncbi:MAG: glutamate racemase [Bacteroidales bacterium]|nr:glutamate racemase [Candidatus Liminaster caballi]
MNSQSSPIGIFDSGFGGLSIFREIRHLMPQYDYIFLGDNGRAPYGDRSFQEVFDFTNQAVMRLFDMGCPLVILACNTASAKALRNIQQNELPSSADPTRRVLGVIRPTVERVSNLTYSGHIGLVATRATVSSQSYDMELAKTAPHIHVTSRACPRWVPLIESGRLDAEELYLDVRSELSALLDTDPDIDTIILGCTHYPLITSLIQKVLQELDHPEIILMPQGKPVSYALRDYLYRHPEMETRLSRQAGVSYYTTGEVPAFENLATIFLGHDSKISALPVIL